MELLKLQNFSLRRATEFTDMRLICKFVLFWFSGTRKTTLYKQCQKLCVYWKSFILSPICI